MSPVHELLRRAEEGARDCRPQLGSADAALPQAPAVDPLAAAIADIARHYGAPISPVSLTAGLALVNGRLPLQHVGLAARRAGFTADVGKNRISSLNAHDLPVVAVRDDGRATLVWSMDQPGRNGACATVSEAGRPDDRQTIAVELFEKEIAHVVRMTPAASAVDEPASGNSRWLREGFAGSARIYADAVAASIAINIVALALPLYTMSIYDRVVPNNAIDTLWALSIGVLLATAFDFVLKTLRSHAVDMASRRADVQLATLVFSRLVGARIPDKPVAAGIRANTMREFETLREFFNSVTLTTLGDLPFLLLFVGAIAMIAGPLSLVVIAALPLLIGAGWLVQRSMTRRTEQNLKESAAKNAVVVETLVGLETIKAAGAESWAADKWERAVAEHVRSGLALRRISNLGVTLVGLISGLVQIVMVIVGCYMVAEGAMTSGTLVAATMLAGRALAPMSQLALLVSKLHQARAAYKSLNELVGAPQERGTGQRFIVRDALEGGFACEELTYSYDKDAAPALRDVSFDIKPGERVGIIGGIGSGKSTLLKLMVALHHPTSGRLLVDGIPAHQLDPACLRAQVALCLQGGDLFQGTLRSNIALAAPQATDDAILTAARDAGALDWITRLPRGLDTIVRERGGGLSRGQRQSVVLARALLQRPPVLLLDEPTSDMDLWSEQQTVRRIGEATKGRTLIIVTHRPAPLDIVDRLIVLDQGRKIADGPKAAVMARLKEFARARETGATPTPKPTAAPVPFDIGARA